MQHQHLDPRTLRNDTPFFIFFTNNIVFCEYVFGAMIVCSLYQSSLSLIYDEHFIKLLAFLGNDLPVIVDSLLEPRSQLLDGLHRVVVEVRNVLDQVGGQLPDCHIA
jgi:hypothetical protein